MLKYALPVVHVLLPIFVLAKVAILEVNVNLQVVVIFSVPILEFARNMVLALLLILVHVTMIMQAMTVKYPNATM